MASPNRLGLFDDALRSRYGARHIVGVDEAGRGPLAGPVVAAAVLLPERDLPELEGVRDSKRVAPARREKLFTIIRRVALHVGVGWSSSLEIDSCNILNATLSAMRRALERVDLARGALIVVIDGDKTVPGINASQHALVDGDAYSLSVASASIVAKVVRDRWMGVLERRFPGYGFGRNKGYGTTEHMKALEELGPSAIHRKSFRPVAAESLLL